MMKLQLTTIIFLTSTFCGFYNKKKDTRVKMNKNSLHGGGCYVKKTHSPVLRYRSFYTSGPVYEGPEEERQVKEYFGKLGRYYSQRLRDAAINYVKNLPKEVRHRYPANRDQALHIFKYTDQEFAEKLIEMEKIIAELRNKLHFLQDPECWERVDASCQTKLPYYHIDFFHRFFPPAVAANYKDWVKEKRILKQAVKDLDVFAQAEREALERSPNIAFTEEYIKMKLETIAKKDSAMKNLERILDETAEESRNHFSLGFYNPPLRF